MGYVDNMDNKIKVSVIIPVYNVEKYLPTCVNSVLHQTLKDIEIILVDDESPDNCPQMCDQYAQQDSRVKVIHKKNGGLGMARNSGLEVATGEYIAFLDSDDYVDLDTYEKLYSIAKQKKLDMLRFGLDRFINEGSLIGQNRCGDVQILDNSNDIHQLSLCIYSDPLFKEQEHLFSGGSVCVVLFKHSFLTDNNLSFTSEKKMLSEDFVFTHECYRHIKRIGNIPFTFYHYRFNPDSITTHVDLMKMNKVYEFCDYFTKLYIKDGFSEKIATVYPMGYYLSAMRAQSKLVLLSHLSLKDKKKWFHDVAIHPYTQLIGKEYPLDKMSRFQRVHFWLFSHQYFYSLFFVVKAFKLFKKQ